MSDIETLREFLEIPLGSSDELFERFLKLPGAIFRGHTPKRFLYLKGSRENKVLLVAHADSYWDGDDCGVHQIEVSDGIIRSSNNRYGLGADDRAGCAILWLLRNSGHSLLITDGEESGRKGSNWLMEENEDIATEININHQFVIQLDRRNGADFKCYSVGTEEFRDYVEKKTGYYKPDRSSYTDIVTICRDITGVNFSIGYRNEHLAEECLHIKEWQRTLDLCRTWLSEKELPMFTLKNTTGLK